MITSLNTNNSSDYKALFKSAYAFLKENVEHLDANRQASINAMTGITSVQQYFSHIKDLLDLSVYGGRRYLMLPLDEPYFEVDADKREITVPAAFKKNGISVQGDEIAESLIFKINRFFDYTDFANFVRSDGTTSENGGYQVQVQWENANKEQGVSDAFVVDTQKDADHLYIMWPLTEAITKYAGTVKFSLRFYKKNGNTLDYSFSTKIAAATINAGHDFEVENWSTGFDNASGRFIGAITNSKNLAQEDAMAPYFIINLDDAPEGSEVENADYNDGKVIEAYIDPDHPSQILRVHATSNDAGDISYAWRYTDTLNTNFTSGLTYNLVGVDDYIATKDTEKDPHKVYYKPNGSGENITYLPTEFVLEEGVTLYERTNTYVVAAGKTGYNTASSKDEIMPHVVGEYKAIATNTVGDNFEPSDSLTINFPAPKKLEYVETGKLTKNSYLNAAGEGEIEVEVAIDERGATSSFTWLFSDVSINGPYKPIDDDSISAAEQAKMVPSKVGNKGILKIAGKPGFYKVIPASTRNYHTIELDEEMTTKVTMPLQFPVITSPAKDTALTSLYGAVTMTVEVTPITSALESEGITYQWYKWNEGEKELIEGATGPSYTVPQKDDNAYCCVVTNHMGEDTRDTVSKNFSVQPFALVPEDTNNEEENGNTEG